MKEQDPVSALQYVKGIGPKRAALYAKLGISDADALLRHFPRSYIDCTVQKPIGDLSFGESAAVRAKVYQKLPTRIISGGRRIAKALVSDGMHSLAIVFFNIPYACEALTIGAEYVFYGKTTGNLAVKEMVNPLIVKPEEAATLLPVYRLTKGLTSRQIAKNVAGLLASGTLCFADALPETLRRRYDFPDYETALRTIHAPQNNTVLEQARRRLIFEELLTLQLALSSLRRRKEENLLPVRASLSPFTDALPFTLTGAQKNALADCLADMGGAHPMSRLIQGDVGSGKTMVAAGCAYAAAACGIQTVLMAPTEILAVQHAETLERVLGPLGVRVALLTGSCKRAQKTELAKALTAGEIDLLVGTHAVLQKNVSFARLGLVITDEQHRFGVEQRKILAEKGENPHVLVMSATPIPRSLALAIYGDLDISVIDELPKGRLPVKTYLIDSSKRSRMFGFMEKLMAAGQQGYIVCPAVEENPETDNDTGLLNVTDYAKKVAHGVFPNRRVAALHGRMKNAEKEQIMADFAAHKLDLLVTTTVIEVGVDVPNASFIAIENAERFGLSQLHQLRGRVGRGQLASHCILLSDEQNELTLRRLKALCATNDGFVIAEEDLRLRGPGDFFGARQHGLPQMRIADLATDVTLLEQAKKEAEKLLAAPEEWKTEPLGRAVEQLLGRLTPGTCS